MFVEQQKLNGTIRGRDGDRAGAGDGVGGWGWSTLSNKKRLMWNISQKGARCMYWTDSSWFSVASLPAAPSTHHSPLTTHHSPHPLHSPLSTGTQQCVCVCTFGRTSLQLSQGVLPRVLINEVDINMIPQMWVLLHTHCAGDLLHNPLQHKHRN